MRLEKKLFCFLFRSATSDLHFTYPKLNNIKSFHSEDTILKDGFLYCHEVWLFLLTGGKKA